MKEIFKAIINFITNRMFILFFAFLVMFTILILKLFQLQIVDGEKYLNDFKAKIQKKVAVEGIRGNIFDRYGRAIAKNDYAFTVILEDAVDFENKNEMLYKLINIIEGNNDKIMNQVPIRYKDNKFIYSNGITEYDNDSNTIKRFKKAIFNKETKDLNDKELNESAEDVYKYLIKLFDIDEKYGIDMSLKIIALRYEIFMKRYTSYKPIKVAINVSENTVAMIKERQTVFPNIVIETEPIRVYPYGELFTHIVGYTGKITDEQYQELKSSGYDNSDIVGRIGIEKEMEKYLKGTDGEKIIEVANHGIRKNILDIKNPTKGDDVYLSIDKDLQEKTYTILVEKLKEIILGKIVLNKTSDRQISLSEVFCALLNNNFISIDNLEESNEVYQSKLYDLFTVKEEQIGNQLTNLILSNTILENYNETMRSFYDTFVQDMINKKLVKTDYREDDEFYELYKTDKKSALEFLNYCLDNELINLESFDIQAKDNDKIIEEIVSKELNNIKKSKNYKMDIYNYIIKNNYISHKDLLLLMFEQNLITFDDNLVNDVKNSKAKPIDVIKEKIMEDEITPQNLALDPSSGSVVVVDVNNGEVLSLVSYPSYDNNRLVNNFDIDYYNQLLQDKSKPLIFRALKERSAPGSTFKMVSAMAGLEEGVITPNEKITTRGIFTKMIGPQKPACWIYNMYRGSHGTINIKTALEVSCNYFFYELGYRLSLNESGNGITHILGLHKLSEYAEMFGLGSKTGIELDEYEPRISDKDAVRSSIGQGNHNYSPANLARYVATLANGGTCYDLSIIDKVIKFDGSITEQNKSTIASQHEFKPENLQAVYQGMKQVTSGTQGTVRRIFSDFPMEVAGKTGTAQENKKRDEHALFVGFAPYDKPVIAISVVIPFGYSSNYSAEIFKDIVSAYFELDDQKVDYSLENQFSY